MYAGLAPLKVFKTMISIPAAGCQEVTPFVDTFIISPTANLETPTYTGTIYHN
tara:strand:+ start:145 stop:303 length:159 start_codon:yes stop_codon:yes gene_type:complete